MNGRIDKLEQINAFSINRLESDLRFVNDKVDQNRIDAVLRQPFQPEYREEDEEDLGDVEVDTPSDVPVNEDTLHNLAVPPSKVTFRSRNRGSEEHKDPGTVVTPVAVVPSVPDIDPDLLRSRLNTDEKRMMQELLDVTVAGNQTLVKELRKMNKRGSKSRKASGAGDGGDGSDSSSDSDGGGGPRRGDGEGHPPARKPRRPDKDGGEKDDREGPGDGSAMVRDIFKSTRRSSFMGADWMDIGDDPGGVPPVAGRDRNSIGDMLQRLDYMHAGSKPDTLTVQHPLTKEDLWLWDPPTVFGLIAFFEKMEEVARYLCMYLRWFGRSCSTRSLRTRLESLRLSLIRLMRESVFSGVVASWLLTSRPTGC